MRSNSLTLVVRCLVAVSLAGTVGASAAIASEEAQSPETAFAYRPAGAFNLYLYQGSLGVPAAVAIDAKHGEVWVADAGKDLAGVFAANGVSLFAFGSAELLKQPQRMAIAPSGDLLVVEGKRHVIRRFNYRGEYLGDVALDKLDPEAAIGAIAFDPAGNLYVADNHTNQIFVYNSSGRLRVQFGSRGTGEGQFLAVAAMAIAPDGSIFVVDQQGVPVQSFDNQGNYLTGWGAHDMGRQNFALPSGVAVNSKGSVIVSDELRHDVKVFDAQGHVLQLFGGQGKELGAFSFPTYVAVDADDRLYVAERGNKRVQIFELAPFSSPAPAKP